MKRWAAIGLLLFLALIGIYIGSPYYAVYSLRNSALNGDVDALEAKVDFPAVRESLKSQLSAAMMAKMQNDPEMQNNPFAGLGMMMMPTIVDRMVDAYVTADGIGAMVRGRKPKDTNNGEINPDISTESEYLGLDRFRLRTRNTKSGENGPSFVLERTGFISWKMTRLEIPPEILQES